MNIKERIEEIYPEIVAIRRDIHMYPELGRKEHRTAARVCEYFGLHSIPCRYPVADTGVVGILSGSPDGKTVGLRADMDALPLTEADGLSYRSRVPGVMHACGHDVHTAILMGTARILKELGETEPLPGSVKFFFQPNEEADGGAERMIQEGCLENPHVDYCLGLHVGTALPVGHIGLKYGKSQAATGEVLITVHGKSCHGAHPEDGVDAIVIAANIVTALQTVVSRSISATDSIVLTIGKIEGGTKSNIIADTVSLEGTLRSLDKQTREEVKQRITSVTCGIAAAHGGSAEVEFQESYIALVNNSGIMDVVKKTAIEAIGEEKIHILTEPSLGAEDFSYFADARPGAFYSLGGGNPELGLTAETAPGHSRCFNVDEECIKTGIELQVKATLALMARRHCSAKKGKL